MTLNSTKRAVGVGLKAAGRAIAIGCLVGLPASGATAAEPDAAALSRQAAALFGVLPDSAPNPANPTSPAKEELGRLLYFDTRLSKNHDISCNSCHPLASYGADGEVTSPGHRGQRGGRNSPTSLNAALHIAQFWDGREPDVEHQALGPPLNPIEMAMPSGEAVAAVLASIPAYPPMFAAAFPGDPKVSYENMGRAIGAFERSLLTPSAFDAFMAGDLGALDAAQRQGLQTFIETGCIACHLGPAVGGGLYRKLGLVNAYPTEDPGRFAVTGNEADRGVFKVPSLRNVAQTAPYFHDGSVATLERAVRLMAFHQLGKELDDSQVDSVIAFLGSLTGELAAEVIATPKLPESGPTTPAPDPK